MPPHEVKQLSRLSSGDETPPIPPHSALPMSAFAHSVVFPIASQRDLLSSGEPRVVSASSDRPGWMELIWRDVWPWLTRDIAEGGWITVLKWLLIFIVLACVLFWTIKGGLSQLAKVLEALKGIGFTLPATGDKRAAIRRRSQFCSVLASDLATLSKVESWNDQYFTDLEAEVEAEGGYYATALHRVFRRQSVGLRRVPSLIQAISSSTEQCLLLVGEAGSGKSVALRHLAQEQAESTRHSSAANRKVPLYINLKELGAAPSTGPTADFIRQFVLDNVRRGDSDTAAYVREHWDDYRQRGIWFFLFDSFDEIPAVLHSASGSLAIRQHAEAIRHFLEGMSSCRGVLASREFKGPDTLPWQKVRILALDEARRDRLVGNSFLNRSQLQIVREHLAGSVSSLVNNPLFVSLLCRHVKEEGRPPLNDYDLISRHISRLVTRDVEYVHRTYRVTAEDLAAGAVLLAVQFATNSRLSLAPTQDEIRNAVDSGSIPGGDLENLLAALVYAKVGRSDVQNARAGDRRFTFSHRRYQEALFVRYLTENPGFISAKELLTDYRWREYAVTLLQTQPGAAVKPVIEEAANLLMAISGSQAPVEVSADIPEACRYYSWDGQVRYLLTLLQEGLARRSADVPDSLRARVAEVLQPRWKDGDLHDRSMVIALGGLLPEELLAGYMSYAVFVGTPRMTEVAFAQAVFLRRLPRELREWIQDRLSVGSVNARRHVDQLRLDALAARLPDSGVARDVLRRARLLRKLLYPFWMVNGVVTVPARLMSVISSQVFGGAPVQGRIALLGRTVLQGGFLGLAVSLVLLLEVAFFSTYLGARMQSLRTRVEVEVSGVNGPRLFFVDQFIAGIDNETIRRRLSITFGLWAFVVVCVALLWFSRRLERVSLIGAGRALVKAVFSTAASKVGKVWIFVLGCVVFYFPIGILIVGNVSGMSAPVREDALIFGGWAFEAVMFLFVTWFRRRRQLARFRTALLSSKALPLALLSARSLNELGGWLGREPTPLTRDSSGIRVLSKLVLWPQREGVPEALHQMPLYLCPWEPNEWRRVATRLEQDILRDLAIVDSREEAGRGSP